MSREEFLSSLSHSFDVEKVETQYKPTKRHTFGMLIENDWYKLSAKEQIIDESDPVKRLDVSILQDNLLSPILDIDDPKTNDRIDFIGGIRGLGELERRCKEDMKLAFAMYPTSIVKFIIKQKNNSYILLKKFDKCKSVGFFWLINIQ